MKDGSPIPEFKPSNGLSIKGSASSNPTERVEVQAEAGPSQVAKEDASDEKKEPSAGELTTGNTL